MMKRPFAQAGFEPRYAALETDAFSARPTRRTLDCGSTVLGTPESVGMNGQIDRQAQQISHLVCSLAGQRCSEA